MPRFAGALAAFVSCQQKGTLAGVGAFLKEQRKDVAIALADPMGAAMYHHFKDGEVNSEGSSITEGIGQGRITGNLEGLVVDEAYQSPTRRRPRSSSTY